MKQLARTHFRRLLLVLPLILAPVAAPAATHTNVLQNVNFQLTFYEQGTTNANGKKISDEVTTYSTKNLIEGLGAALGLSFGQGAKLVLSSVYTAATVASNVFSTSLALNATNGFLSVGGSRFYGIYGDAGILVISNNTIISGPAGNISSDVISNLGGAVTNSIIINTNTGYLTTLTPSVAGGVTNISVVTQIQTAAPSGQSTLTNSSSSIDVLWGGKANNLTPVGNYISFTPASPQVVVETGVGLNSSGGVTASNLASQTAFSIQTIQLSYFAPTGPTNLTLTLQGFVKQTLKVDVLSSHPIVYEDIFGANSTWNVNGSGYAGGAYSTDATGVPILEGFLTNGVPVVAEGTVNINFLQNLAQ